MGLPKVSRRTRYIVLVVVTLYVLISVQWNTSRINHHFYNSVETLLPSTGRADDVNLKNLEMVDLSKSTDAALDLRVQLARQFPYDSAAPLPRKVWQTWKSGAESASFPTSFSSFQSKWKSFCEQAVPGYQYQLITDNQMVPLLKQLYGGVPQVIKAFESLPLPILKADFFRYLIMYARGGIYSDMDTFPLKPFDSWPSTSIDFRRGLKNPIKYRASDDELGSYTPPEPGFVIGIEADPDREDWAEWYARRIQFCQWTMQAKPGHPVLRELIANITSTTLSSVAHLKSSLPLDNTDIIQDFSDDYNVNMRDKRRLDKNYKHSQKKTAKNTDGTDIMNWTGPGIFSDVVFQYLNNIIQKNSDILLFNDNLQYGDTKKHVSNDGSTMKFYNEIVKKLQNEEPTLYWGFFSLITKPTQIDDVLVLPITAFSPDVEQMGSKSMEDPMALVKHMFEGSWKHKDKASNQDNQNAQDSNDVQADIS